MKILAISNLYPPDVIGGYEICCQQVIDGLRSRGHEVRVLTTVPRCPCGSMDHIVRELELINCYDAFDKQRSRPVTEMLGLARASFVSAHNVHVLNNHLERFKPEVVYLWNLFGIGGLALFACLDQQGFPWVWYLGDCVPLKLCSLGEEVLPGLVDQLGRHSGGSYMAVSQRMLDEIQASGLRLTGEVSTSPNWITGRQPAPRTQYYRPGERLRIVSAGQLGRHKGIHLLVEGAAILRSRGYENFSIDLYGKTADRSIESLARDYGVTELVSFKGVCTREELIRRYARHEYDVFAFLTWKREPFGCAPLEAAAYGTVMVMSESCGIGEWFVADVHCFKVARTAEAFADVMADVLDGKVDLRPVGRRASAVIWRDFHLDRLLSSIETALIRAATHKREAVHKPDGTFRLALLAEKLAKAWVQEKNWLPAAA